jgi:hypothetical protein
MVKNNMSQVLDKPRVAGEETGEKVQVRYLTKTIS